MKAAFAAGCFWGVQKAFDELGVETVVGFMGGKEEASYDEVSSGKTGHAETILIEYDPKKVSYKELLKVFWKIHDPTTKNRQGPDIGSQYRSVIFYFNEEQETESKESKKHEQKKQEKPIVTEIVKASEFYKAEEYHQKYYKKNKSFVC